MQGSSVEIPDDDSILEEIFHDLDFDFDLSHVHSDATNLLQSFVKGEVVKSLLKKQYQKVSLLKNAAVKKKESMTRSLLQRRKNFSSENLIALLEAKKKQFEETVNAPPFIRTSDKIAFTLGILGMCITEWILLTKQNLMYIWYTILLVPLMIARYVTYSKSKYQYFMLDFCYFAQLMMLAHLYIIPQNTLFFQVAFAASNGPLLVGLVMWRNSIVFHDLDKLTSVFIHFFPPLVSFCARWYPPNNDFSAVCGEEECSTSMSTVLGVTMAFYTFWQVLYLIQTEIIDKKKLQADCQIMTSFRWMSEVKPHPLWRVYRKFGAQAKHAAYYLVVTQFFYTLLTLLPIIPIFHSFNMHCIYLSLVFAICVWNGANFYFDIFTETYSKRLQKFIKQTIKEEENQVNDNAHTNGQEESKHKEVEPVISQVELKEGSE